MTTDNEKYFIVDKIRAEIPSDTRYLPKPTRSWVFTSRHAATTFQKLKTSRAKKPMTFVYTLRTAMKGPDFGDM